MQEGRLDPISVRYLIVFLIVTLLFLFLVVVSGAILTADWIRIYTYVIVFEWVFILAALGTDRMVANFRFIQNANTYDFMGLTLNDFQVDTLFGILAGIILVSGRLFNLSFGILPDIALSTAGSASQFTVQFIAPLIEETLIAGILVLSAYRWFSRLGLGFMVFLTGIAVTFLLYVTVSALNIVGILLIAMGLVMMLVYPLNRIILRGDGERWAASIFFAAVFFAGLHSFAFQNNPNFAAALIAVFLFAVVVNIVNVYRKSIAFSLTAHMTYNGLSFMLLSNGNLALVLIVGALFIAVLQEIVQPAIAQRIIRRFA